jgi:hypothetical protein
VLPQLLDPEVMEALDRAMTPLGKPPALEFQAASQSIRDVDRDDA